MNCNTLIDKKFMLKTVMELFYHTLKYELVHDDYYEQARYGNI